MDEEITLETNSPQGQEPVEAIVYFSQKTLIDNYWIKKKTEMVHLRKEMTASEYDEEFKEVHKEEARKLYPHKGRYILKGTVLTYIGDV
jgi:hypothetical protein